MAGGFVRFGDLRKGFQGQQGRGGRVRGSVLARAQPGSEGDKEGSVGVGVRGIRVDRHACRSWTADSVFLQNRRRAGRVYAHQAQLSTKVRSAVIGLASRIKYGVHLIDSVFVQISSHTDGSFDFFVCCLSRRMSHEETESPPPLRTV